MFRVLVHFGTDLLAFCARVSDTNFFGAALLADKTSLISHGRPVDPSHAVSRHICGKLDFQVDVVYIKIILSYNQLLDTVLILIEGDNRVTALIDPVKHL